MVSQKQTWRIQSRQIYGFGKLLAVLCIAQLFTAAGSFATEKDDDEPGDGKPKPTPVTQTLPPTSVNGHWVKTYKNERQMDFEPGQTTTVNVDCQPGDLAVDGSWRVDQSDQGNLHEILPYTSSTSSERSFTVTLTNTADGRAQAKAFVVCLRGKTSRDKGHEHSLESYQVKQATVSRTDRKVITSTGCKEQEVVVAPGFAIKDGSAELVKTGPSDTSLRKWNWSFVTNNAKVETSYRCLKLKTSQNNGHRHALDIRITPSWPGPLTTIPGKSTVERSTTCADDRKGIVAFYDTDPYGKVNPHGNPHGGNDPRPKTRAFKFINDDASPISVRFGVLCSADRTSKEIK